MSNNVVRAVWLVSQLCVLASTVHVSEHRGNQETDIDIYKDTLLIAFAPHYTAGQSDARTKPRSRAAT